MTELTEREKAKAAREKVEEAGERSAESLRDAICTREGAVLRGENHHLPGLWFKNPGPSAGQTGGQSLSKYWQEPDNWRSGLSINQGCPEGLE